MWRWRMTRRAISISRRWSRRRAAFPAWWGLIWPAASPARNPTAGTRCAGPGREGYVRQTAPRYRVVALDYGAKRNILRCLASVGADVTVLPATATAPRMSLGPDGVFLSNGPGDPAATGAMPCR